MKSMLRILGRYVGSAAGIALILLILNAALFLLWVTGAKQENGNSYRVSVIADGLAKEGEEYTLSESARQAMSVRYEWAMLLSDSGEILWSLNLPRELSRTYTIPEVASFTKWYLQDYPVYVWRHQDGLLVVGCPKGSVWKTGMEMPQNIMDKTILWIPIVLAANGLAAVLLALLLGLRLFRSMHTLVKGIEQMAAKQPVQLGTNGVLGELAAALNQTSRELQRQEIALQKREQARTSWIAGISHDIRTPLSMVMGYASQLEDNQELPRPAREQAGIVRQQSQRIKTLVNDLNLASKLEYDMQPLHQEEVLLAPLLRQIAADFLNGGLARPYSLELDVGESARQAKVLGDQELLRRAVYNLIQNSIRHNPQGCAIRITLERVNSCWVMAVADNGKGFDQELLDRLKEENSLTGMPSHGLGLTLVRQIARVHEGTTEFENLPEGGCRVVINLPPSS